LAAPEAQLAALAGVGATGHHHGAALADGPGLRLAAHPGLGTLRERREEQLALATARAVRHPIHRIVRYQHRHALRHRHCSLTPFAPHPRSGFMWATIALGGRRTARESLGKA